MGHFRHFHWPVYPLFCFCFFSHFCVFSQSIIDTLNGLLALYRSTHCHFPSNLLSQQTHNFLSARLHHLGDRHVFSASNSVSYVTPSGHFTAPNLTASVLAVAPRNKKGVFVVTLVLLVPVLRRGTVTDRYPGFRNHLYLHDRRPRKRIECSNCWIAILQLRLCTEQELKQPNGNPRGSTSDPWKLCKGWN